MRALHTSRRVAFSLAVVVMPLTTGCGDDEPTGNGDTIVGTWTATSLTAPTQPGWGDAVVDDGLSVTIVFNDNGGYSFTVANDDPADPWICNNTATCNWSGTYTASGSTLTFDQGTTDEMSAAYTLSGNTLTITFSAGGGITDPYVYVLTR